jgi:ATP-dependent Clp protease ATP-binding subunit ClpC
MQMQFTGKAEDALNLAAKCAKQLKQGYIGTEHILVGLIKEGSGVASRVLADNNVTTDGVMKMIKELIAFESGVVLREREGYSPRAEKVLEDAHKQAKRRRSIPWLLSRFTVIGCRGNDSPEKTAL